MIVGAVLVPVIMLLIVLVLASMALKRFSGRQVAQSDRLQNADRPTLRYAVPPGQDPALVVAELTKAGYDASPDSEPGPSSATVIIGSHGGEPDRESVRQTLARIDGTNIVASESEPVQRDHVRFADEV
jgi:hypothetical protein